MKLHLTIALIACGLVANACAGEARPYQVGAAKGPYFLVDSRVVEDRWLVLEGTREVRRHMALREDALDLAGTGDEPTWRLRRVR